MSMEHLKVTATCIGDGITAISESQKIAKALGKSIFLDFTQGFSICVRPTSDVQDLISIWQEKLKNKNSN